MSLRSPIFSGHWLKLWHIIAFLLVLMYLLGVITSWFWIERQVSETTAITKPRAFEKIETVEVKR